MADHSSETKPEVKKPEYFTVPTPAPNGKAPESPPLGVRSIEPTTPARHPSDVVAEAAGQVLRAVLGQIAHHEAHLQRLRAVLAQFAGAARQNVTPTASPAEPASGDTLIRQLLSVAQALPREGEGEGEH